MVWLQCYRWLGYAMYREYWQDKSLCYTGYIHESMTISIINWRTVSTTSLMESIWLQQFNQSFKLRSFHLGKDVASNALAIAAISCSQISFDGGGLSVAWANSWFKSFKPLSKDRGKFDSHLKNFDAPFINTCYLMSFKLIYWQYSEILFWIELARLRTFNY